MPKYPLHTHSRLHLAVLPPNHSCTRLQFSGNIFFAHFLDHIFTHMKIVLKSGLQVIINKNCICKMCVIKITLSHILSPIISKKCFFKLGLGDHPSRYLFDNSPINVVIYLFYFFSKVKILNCCKYQKINNLLSFL